VTAAVGTNLSLSLITPLSTETAKVETPVTARVRQPIVVDGFTVIPVGATLHGDVVEVERAGRVRGRSRLVIRFAEVQINGQRDPLRTNPLTFEGEQTKGEDAVKVGGGAGIGAVIGGIVGGASGAAKGAAIGGAAGAGTVLATRGRDVVLAEGTELNATSASPYSVRVEVKQESLGLRGRVGCCRSDGRLARGKSNSRVGAVAERLSRRRTAATQRDWLPIDRIGHAIPVDHLNIIAVDHVRAVLPQSDRGHKAPHGNWAGLRPMPTMLHA
jgi:hypothetical protein